MATDEPISATLSSERPAPSKRTRASKKAAKAKAGKKKAAKGAKKKGAKKKGAKKKAAKKKAAKGGKKAARKKAAGKSAQRAPERGTDPLTGLPEREPWHEGLEAQIRAALHEGRALSVALFDVDGFAKHQEELETDRADALLRGIAERLAKAVSETADSSPAEARAPSVGRLGGDVFGVVFADVEVEQALAQVGLARAQMLRTPFKVGRGLRRRDVQPTLSVGVAGLRRDGRTGGELLARAQSALWRAKALGGARLGLPSKERMGLKTSYYPQEQLDRLKQLAHRSGIKESVLLREALGDLLLKFKARRPDPRDER